MQLKRVGTLFATTDTPLYIAREIVAVGIIPSTNRPAIGTRHVIAGQPIVVVGYATRDDFLQAVADAGLSDQAAFQACPHDVTFLRISTD